ncbi:MAG: ABC transporter ATP-binding protein [Acidobacteria bacterium]|nr:ABC transporter ATP-binding protein [Acidobacteriota bacterium]
MNRLPIEARGVSYAYAPGHWAVRNVDLDVPAGARIALLGANGAGKSTLLLLLSGAEHVCHGEILLHGSSAERSREGLRRWRREVGLLLQDPEDQLLAPTVEQDVAFGPLRGGVEEPRARQLVERALADMAIPHLATRPVHELSLGEKKRVALAGLLVQAPAVLLLDEPAAGLDPGGVRALREMLDTLARAGTAIIMATHDVDFAYEWASEVCVLFQGGILARGEPAEILADREMLTHASLEPPLLLEAALAVGGPSPFPRSRPEFREWARPTRRIAL